MAKDIGKDVTFDEETHPSIQKISENVSNMPDFHFSPVSQDFISKVNMSFDHCIFPDALKLAQVCPIF